MKKPAPTRRCQPSEGGYVLVMVILLVALLTIALAVAMPKVTKEIQRDREVETMHRGKQYIRAIKLYYTKFGAYPASLDALTNTNNIRFLRKKYTDPITGKDDWKLIPVGMNKAPTVMGFFGVPLGSVGIGCGTNPPGSTPTTPGSTPPPVGSTTPPTGTPAGGTANTSTIGSLTTNCIGDDQTPSGATATNPDGTPVAPNSTSTSTNTNTSTTGSAAGQTGSSTTGLNGLGAGPFMGVSPASPKQSILIYKTKKVYNQWEFVYDPLAEQLLMSSISTASTTNTAGPNQPTTGPTGSPVGGSGPITGMGGGGGYGSGNGGGAIPGGTTPVP